MNDAEINDCYTALGRAFAERRDLIRKVDDMEKRLKEFGWSWNTLMDNPAHEESQKRLADMTDPVSEFQEWRAAVNRIAELNKVLSD